MATTATRTKVKNAAATLTADDPYMETVSKEFAALKADISDISERLATIAQTGTKSAKYQSRKAIADAKSTGDDLLAELLAQVEDIEGKAVRKVREKPLQSIGIAAGIGFLAALILRR